MMKKKNKIDSNRKNEIVRKYKKLKEEKRRAAQSDKKRD